MENEETDPGAIVDADTSNIFEKIDTWLDGFLRLLPNIGVAIVVLVIFIAVAYLVSKMIRSSASSRGRDSLGDVAGSLVKWGLIILGVMLAVTIVAPSVKPADLIAGLGVGSVAIGFAFRDILQNMLAGILILLRQPFEVGDQIVSGGHEGTVEKIETRATFIKTYDGRRVVIPNADIYTDAVVVNTAFDHIRSQYDVGVGCNDYWQRGKELILEALKETEGVLSDPAPEALPWAIADFSNNIRARWWTDSERANVVHVHARVIENIYMKLDGAGIDMPYPTSVMLFHDQTDEHDGVRSKQREGWPPAKEKDDPKTARVIDGMLGPAKESQKA